MNIPQVSPALAPVPIPAPLGVAMLSKAMESSEAEGASLINMMDRSMELSVNPYVGGNIDMLV